MFYSTIVIVYFQTIKFMFRLLLRLRKIKKKELFKSGYGGIAPLCLYMYVECAKACANTWRVKRRGDQTILARARAKNMMTIEWIPPLINMNMNPKLIGPTYIITPTHMSLMLRFAWNSPIYLLSTLQLLIMIGRENYILCTS